MLKDFCKENSTQRYMQYQRKQIQTANDWLHKMASYEPSDDFLFPLGLKNQSQPIHDPLPAFLTHIILFLSLPPHSHSSHMDLNQRSAVGETRRVGRWMGIPTQAGSEYSGISLSSAPCVYLPWEPSRSCGCSLGKESRFLAINTM